MCQGDINFNFNLVNSSGTVTRDAPDAEQIAILREAVEFFY